MKPFLRHALLASAVLFPLSAMAAPETAAPETPADAPQQSDEIVVTGINDQITTSSTGLALTLRETPQSVTIIDRERIEAFALNNANDLLAQTVGINVERSETERTYFNARGFDITNFQVDGVGLPLIWGLQTGDLDTALFERVESIRGANGLMTGVGNPSATINYVRKRPTEELRATLEGQYGSWDRWRVVGDVSGALTSDGTVKARAVVAHEQGDSYLDRYSLNRDVYGAILSWDITPQLTATAGYTRQQNDAKGVMWGALPMLFSNGERIPWDVSATSAADWTFWNVRDETAFGELRYDLGGGWSVKGTFNYRHWQELAKILYPMNYSTGPNGEVYGNPDPVTGLGMGGSVGIYPSQVDQYFGDLSLSGPFQLFGREHQLSVALSYADADTIRHAANALTAPPYPSVYDWGDSQVVEPAYGPMGQVADTNDKLLRANVATHLNFTDRLRAVLGFSAAKLKSTGQSYGADQGREDSAISPYVGALFDVAPNVTLYASYTDIFNPQIAVDRTNRRLDPAKGNSIEAGIKSEWFGGKLLATASIFRAKQRNLAAVAGQFGPGEPGPLGTSYYVGEDTTSRGFEVELAGNITPNWRLSGGYTGLEIEDNDGDPTRLFIPTKSLKLATTYTVPELRNFALGAQFRAQNRVRRVTTPATIVQGAYSVLDLMAGIDVIERLRLTLNIRNVTNSKYLNSVQWDQAFYAAPRNVNVSLRFAY